MTRGEHDDANWLTGPTSKVTCSGAGACFLKIAGLAGEYCSADASSARSVVMDQGPRLETPEASLHELAMLQETEHQRDALLRSLKLEEVGRLGNEIVVESYDFVKVHARQE